MSRCAQSEALLDAIFASADLTRSQADHAVGCSECARALAQARRFDGELRQLTTELAPEPLGPAPELIALRASAEGGHMRIRYGVLATAIAGALAFGVMVWGGAAIRWLSTQPPGVGEFLGQDLDAWIDAARRAAVEDSDWEPARPEDWEATQVETCGDTAIAFYVTEGRASAFLWAIGRPGDLVDRSIATGEAHSLGDPDVAHLRGQLPICEMVIGANAPIDDGLVDPAKVAPQQVVNAPTTLWQFGGEITIPEPGANDGPVGSVTVPAFLFGRIDDLAVRAVDVFTPDGRLRYTVTAPGFLIQVDLPDAWRYELLNSDSALVSAGLIDERPDIVRPIEIEIGPDAP